MSSNIDISPDAKGILRFIQDVAKTDRGTALKLLVEGWPMTVEQAEALLSEDK